MGRFKEDIAGEVRRLAKKTTGAVFWLKKTITSTSVTTAGVDLTNVSSGGDLALEDVILKTNSTGLAGVGTTLRITANNSNGTILVFSALLSLLTTSKTVSLEAARDFMENLGIAVGGHSRAEANMPTILEEGKKLTMAIADTTCTGSGTVDVWMKFRKLEDDSDITAA